MPATAAPGITFQFADPRRTPAEARTDIAGFVGLAERGPFHRPVRIESWHQYESMFGGFGVAGFLPLAVHAFFGNGGMTCDVVRALVPPGQVESIGRARHAFVELPLFEGTSPSTRSLRLIATSPGRWGNGITVEVIPRVVDAAAGTAAFRFALIVRDRTGTTWRLADCSLDPDDVRSLPTVMAATPDLPIRLGARHRGLPDEEAALRTPWIGELPTPPADPLTGGLRLGAGTGALARGADGIAGLTRDHLCGIEDAPDDRNRWGLQALVDTDDVAMIAIPDAVPYPRASAARRRPPPPPDCRSLCGRQLAEQSDPPEEPLEYGPLWNEADTRAISDAAIRFCELRRDCVALIDPPAELRTAEQVRQYRAGSGATPPAPFDTSFGGLYWPWLLVERRPRVIRPDLRRGGAEGPATPPAGPLIAMPPSGLVAGLTAASDLMVGPHRTPAGQTARGALAVTVPVDDDDHGSLNARGVNVLRERVGRGVVLEGTRSLTFDQGAGNPWRHLNVRRVLLAILEAIEERTQWAVFEVNNHRLWADLRDVIRIFLTGRWRRGWLAGIRPEDAFRVRCDGATNPPESLALGRVVAEIELRLPPPIEWIVVRIGRSATGVEVLDVDRA